MRACVRVFLQQHRSNVGIVIVERKPHLDAYNRKDESSDLPPPSSPYMFIHMGGAHARPNAHTRSTTKMSFVTFWCVSVSVSVHVLSASLCAFTFFIIF